MEESFNLKSQRNQNFRISLGEIRPKLAVANGILVILAVGMEGIREDYLIGFSYLTWSLFWYLIPTLKRWGMMFCKFPLLLIDIGITGYMLTRTGGQNSELSFFLFLPIIVAIVRCRLRGILITSLIMSVIYIAAASFTATLNWGALLIKITYLFLAGILGGKLIQKTYFVTEMVSERLVQLKTRLQKLNDFSQEVSSSFDLDVIFNRIIKAVQQNNPNLFVAIALFDESGQLIIWDSSWEEEWLSKYETHPLTKQSISLAPILVLREPLICSDIHKHQELVEIFKGIPIRALYAFPIIIAGEVAGALMATSSTSQILPESDLQIINGISTQAGVALQNLASLNEVKQQADTDGLTGLYNRRYFNNKLEELVNRAKEEGSSLSLIILDVDNFKKYNDTYGHPAGDQLLKTVATVISNAVREGDIVTRYGGEEFTVILKHTDKETALQIGERIRNSVANIPLGEIKSPVTVSLGIGTIPEHATDRVGLIEFADRSLYFSKQTGKNRTSCGFNFKSSLKVKLDN